MTLGLFKRTNKQTTVQLTKRSMNRYGTFYQHIRLSYQTRYFLYKTDV